MEERVARGAEIGAGAVTVEDVTGDAQSLAPGPQLGRAGGAPPTGPCPGRGTTPGTAAARGTGGRRRRSAEAGADHRKQGINCLLGVINVSLILI